MRVHKYWLEYDAAALAFLVVGMAAVELLAMIKASASHHHHSLPLLASYAMLHRRR